MDTVLLKYSSIDMLKRGMWSLLSLYNRLIRGSMNWFTLIDFGKSIIQLGCIYFHDKMDACQISTSWHLPKYREGCWNEVERLIFPKSLLHFRRYMFLDKTLKFSELQFLHLKIRINNSSPQRSWGITLESFRERTQHNILKYELLLTSISNIFNKLIKGE